MAKVAFRPAAEEDLRGLFDYLVQEAAVQIAADYTRRVHAACLALEAFPNRGPLRDDIGVGVRLIGFERRVAIAYCVTGEAVEILGVFYGGRDFSTILRARS